MRTALSLFLSFLAAATARAQAPFGATAIFTHEPPACMSPSQFPTLEAELVPTELAELRRAQVYFKASGTSAWYFVEMEPAEGARLRGILPKPLAQTDRIDYYLFFLLSTFESAQSQHYSTRVSEEGCGSLVAAAPGSSVSIVVHATVANPPGVPLGFSSQGISSLVTAAGNSIAVGSAAGGVGGGLPAAAIGAIAGGGAAAGAVIIAGGGSGDDVATASGPAGTATGASGTAPAPDPSSSPTSSPTPSPAPSPAPSVPDVSGTWNVTDRIVESCLPGTVGQSSSSTMTIQQDDSLLTVKLMGADFSANMTGSIDTAGNIAMRGQFNDEGETGEVQAQAVARSSSEMTGTYTQFYPGHNCTVRGTFSGSKR